jgi:prephenate dehydrogenase
MNGIGLIGFGRFGQLLFQQLKNSVDILIHDPEQQIKLSASEIPFASLSDVCRQELVILAVPVKAINKVTRDIAPLLSDKTIIMDVCAVKTYPLGILEKYLPADVSILGSHPLFGPDSVKENMQGHLMILCPGRIDPQNLQRVKNFWSGFGIELREMTPDEQDRLMAWTLAMTHFLGRSLKDLPLPDTTIATRDYQNLIHLMKKINRDTWDLFEDMHLYNPYTREMRQRLVESMQDLKMKLDRSQITQAAED